MPMYRHNIETVSIQCIDTVSTPFNFVNTVVNTVIEQENVCRTARQGVQSGEHRASALQDCLQNSVYFMDSS